MDKEDIAALETAINNQQNSEEARPRLNPELQPPVADQTVEILASNALLTSIMAGTGALISAIDSDFRYIIFNRSCRDFMKKSFGVDIKTGSSALDPLAAFPEIRDKMKGFWARALSGENFTAEHAGGVAESEVHTCRSNFYPLRDAQGAVIGAAQITQEAPPPAEAKIMAEAERQRLHDVLDTLPVYVILLTPDHRVSFSNRFFRNRFGEDRGQRCFEYLFRRADPCESCETYKVLETRAPHRWQWQGPDGRTYDIFDFPFTDSGGSPLILEAGIDITEIRQAEEALRRANETLEQRVIERTEVLRSSEERFRIAAECSTDLIWEWDIVKGTLAWFGKIDELLGHTPGGFPRTIETWKQVIHPDDHDRVMAALDRHLKNGEPYHVKYRFMKQDGSYGYWIDRGVAFTDEKGSPYKMIGTCSDITEREKVVQALRESREDLNRAQTVARIGSWRLLIQTSKLLCSEECYRIFGIPVGTPVTYKKFLALVHPDDRELVDRKWKTALAGEPYDIEHRLVVGNMVKWVHEQAELEFDPQGRLVSGFGTTQDITARKQMEEEREQLLRQLMKSNKELEQFAYVASHDLQEPLRMVASFTRLLERRYKDRLDQDAREFIHYAVDGALRMQTLIDDLLAYSRVGARDIRFVPTDCNHPLNQALSNLRVAVEESQAIITRGTLPTIPCNASQMTQLFQNLISNAIKFRGTATPRIHIAAESKQNEWLFSVRDNGIGIDPRYKEQVFKIFQRLHSRDEYAGTGIGLALCMKIVELHKGAIWLESELGKGATFYFTLSA